MSVNFWIILLEWYEFTIYNALIPYNVFGGHGVETVYYGFGIFALSFFARPAGAIYFSGYTNKNSALRLSLLIMIISTLLMGIYPGWQSFKPIWFGACKLAQGFAIGGSYGMAYLPTYVEEQKKRRPKTNYRLGIIQTGWVYGMIIGDLTVFLLKLVIGNWAELRHLIISQSWSAILSIQPSTAFVSWGWRIPFLISSILGVILYSIALNIKQVSKKVDTPNPDILKINDEDGFANTSILNKIGKYIQSHPWQFLGIFLVVSIDMTLFHGWFTYYEVVKQPNQTGLIFSLAVSIRKILMIMLFPLLGTLTDLLNYIFGKNAGNNIILCTTCLLMITFSLVKVDFIPWILISSITASLCYGSIVGWVIYKFGRNADFMLGPTFNLTGVVGGLIPIILTAVVANYGPNFAGFFIVALSFVSLVSIILPTMHLRK